MPQYASKSVYVFEMANFSSSVTFLQFFAVQTAQNEFFSKIFFELFSRYKMT